jgi:hypothetical protein
MTVAILDVRPTLESGVELYASAARNFVPRFALQPRQLHRRGLIRRWHLDRQGRLVCAWQSELVCLPVGL